MNDSIPHRSPDAAGIFIDDKRSLIFTHRCLSIIDPSPAGQQSMISLDERYGLCFGPCYGPINVPILKRWVSISDKLCSA